MSRNLKVTPEMVRDVARRLDVRELDVKRALLGLPTHNGTPELIRGSLVEAGVDRRFLEELAKAPRGGSEHRNPERTARIRARLLPGNERNHD
jgi:hypothetical protein